MNTNQASVESQAEIEYPVINVEETDFCKLKVHYVADPEVVDSKINEALVSLRKVKISGFRRGKAPDYAIKARLKPQINQFVAREMATNAIDDIVFETDIKPIGQPKFSEVSIKKNNFSCNIELLKKPEFELGNFKFEIPKPNIESDEEVLAERSLFNLRSRVGDTEPYEEDDFVELGDQITFSFSATIDVDGKKEPFDGSTVEGEMYKVGSDRWNGFDNYLLGMKAGEVRDFDFTFENGPEDLVGKTAQFSVTVHMGTKLKPHPLNEDFYKSMGVKDHDEIMEKLRAISKSTVQREQKEAICNQVAIKLTEGHDFEIPDFLVEEAAKDVAVKLGLETDNLSESESNEISKQAEKNVRLALILDAIRESEPDSVLNDGEAKNHLAQILQAQGQDPNAVLNNPNAHFQIASTINSIKEEFTLQWVADQATIIE